MYLKEYEVYLAAYRLRNICERIWFMVDKVVNLSKELLKEKKTFNLQM